MMSSIYSNNKPNILQVVLDLQYVGEKMVASLARSVSDEFNVMFCCLDRVGMLGEDLQREGFFVTSLNRRNGVDCTLLLKIAQLSREKKIDIIHAHHYTPFFYSSLSRLFNRKPKMCFTEHGRPLPDIVGYQRKLTNLFLNFLVHKINAVSEISKKGLSKNDWFPLSKINVIYNGVELDGKVHDSTDESIQKALDWIGSSNKVIGFLARLDPIKAPELLIESFALVLKEVPDAKLLVMGKGPLRDPLIKLSIRLNIQNNVLFAGLVKNPHLLLQKVRALAVTSLYEAASLSILEAMLCGLPVVATNVGGNPELIQDGKTGYLFPSGSVNELAKTLIKVLIDENRASRLGDAAYIEATYKFSFRKMVDSYKKVYHDLLLK